MVSCCCWCSVLLLRLLLLLFAKERKSEVLLLAVGCEEVCIPVGEGQALWMENIRRCFPGLVSKGMMGQVEVNDVVVVLQNHGSERGTGCVQIQDVRM